MKKTSGKHLERVKKELWEHAVGMSEMVYGKRTLSHVFKMSMTPQYRKLADGTVAIVREQEREVVQYTKSPQVAAAIRDLQLMDDPKSPKKYLFRKKYQWKAILAIMCKYYLLPNNDPGIFCEICNNVDHPRYFLPADHYEIGHEMSHYCIGYTAAKRNRAGNSTYHAITNAPPKEGTSAYMTYCKHISAVSAEFEQLLLRHGAIDQIK